MGEAQRNSREQEPEKGEKSGDVDEANNKEVKTTADIKVWHFFREILNVF